VYAHKINAFVPRYQKAIGDSQNAYSC